MTVKLAKISNAARRMTLMLLCACALAATPVYAENLTFAPIEDREAMIEDSAARVKDARRTLGLQTELPGGSEKMPKEDPLRWLDGFHFKIPQNVAYILLWISVIFIAAAVLMKLRENLWSSSRARSLEFRDSGRAANAAVASRMEQTQLEADDAARAGDFAEAMHILLLQSVSEMRNRLASPIAASLTSREILRRLDLSEDERAIFSTIVGCVEVSYFGNHEPGADEYTEYRRNYDVLTGLLAGERRL
jgi:hypothetical protein